MTTLPGLPNSLQTLGCSTNSLATLPVLPNSLTDLECSANHVSTLPILPNSLNYLICGQNTLTNLPALPNSLQTLVCSTNSLTTLPTLPNSLQHIDCSQNQLTSLPTLPNSLTVLACNNNNIYCFPTFPASISPPTYNIFLGWHYYINIYGNPFNCLPNYLPNAMDTATLAYPLCAAGNTNGCAVAGIEQLSVNSEQITVYPNPTSTSLTLTLSKGEGIYSIALYDMLGNMVYAAPTLRQAQGDIVTIDVSDLSEGVYNLSISTSKGLLNKQVVIER